MTHNAQTVKALLDAATPGKWKIEQLDPEIPIDEGGEVFRIIADDRTILTNGYHPFLPDINNAALIAAAPDIAALYLEQCAVVEKLVEALRFYAEENHWDIGETYSPFELKDDGKTAREVLAAVSKGAK